MNDKSTAQYDLKSPKRNSRNKRNEATASHTVFSKPSLRSDHPAGQPWTVRLQTISKDFTSNFQVSANKVLKTSVPLPREGKGKGHINAGSLLTLP